MKKVKSWLVQAHCNLPLSWRILGITNQTLFMKKMAYSICQKMIGIWRTGYLLTIIFLKDFSQMNSLNEKLVSQQILTRVTCLEDVLILLLISIMIYYYVCSKINCEIDHVLLHLSLLLTKTKELIASSLY